ncbi:hypothetical protein GCM10022630_07660 [Thermobifida alba]
MEKSSSAAGKAALSAIAVAVAATTQAVTAMPGRRYARTLSAAVALQATRAQTNASPTSTISTMMLHFPDGTRIRSRNKPTQERGHSGISVIFDRYV